MSNLNLTTHPLKDSPKPRITPEHPAESWKPDFHKEIAKLPERHRGHVQSFGALQPLHDRVLVRRIEDKTKSRIILADIAKQPSQRAEIIALGPKANWGYKVGDIVFVSPGINMDYSDLIDGNGGYVLIQQADILCIDNRKRK